MMKMAI
jgi:hypothetical protein